MDKTLNVTTLHIIMKTIAPTLRKSLKLQILVLVTILPGLMMFPVPLQANPTGANVVAGQVGFNGLGTSNLTINQGTNTAIIDWQTFSIQQGEVTTFNQPGINAVALNRVVTGNPSAIYGALRANGSVVVVNPNGIVVHEGGVVDVAGMLTMSTLNITNEDFLNGGSNRFKGTSAAGIENYGAISSANGDVVLLGNFLKNAGSVEALDGTVAFGAGGEILVDQGASGASISVVSAGPGAATGIHNTGTVNAAAAEFGTHGNVYAMAIQNDGVVRANGASVRGGRVMLRASGGGSVVNTGQIRANNYDGSGGQISVEGQNVRLEAGSLEAAGVSGTDGGSVNVVGNHVFASENGSIDVSGDNGGSASLSADTSALIRAGIDASGSVGNGGSVDIEGNSVTIGDGANINASGYAAGGRVRAGGGFQGNEDDIENSENTVVESGSVIFSDSEIGNAGTVVIWSDGDTDFTGEISAQAKGVGNGGLVEVSGKQTLGFDGVVSTLSAGGRSGTLLLDPTNVSIGAGGDITSAALIAALGLGNVIIHTNSAGTDTGNINILAGADLQYGSIHDLGLFANGTITIDDDLQNEGVGGVSGLITLFAGWDGTGAGLFTFDPTAPGTIPVETAAIDSATILGGTYGDWGQNGGGIRINNAGADAVAVGSAFNETNLFGDIVNIVGGNANDRHGQVGFRNAALNPTGDINVYAKFFVNLDSNGASTDANGRNDNYVKIGHGGSNVNQTISSGNGNLSGDIKVVAEGSGLIMRNGETRSWSQIGHGGHGLDGNFSGHITIEADFVDMQADPFSSGSQSFVIIGHGGLNSLGTKEGDISVVAEQFINGFSGLDNNTNSSREFVMIGHGGHESGVNAPGAGPDRDANSHEGLAVDENMGGHIGAIYVEAKTGDITFTTGAQADGWNMIGHGGNESHGNHRLTMLSDGSQTTGALKAGITVIAGGDISFDNNVRTNGTDVQFRGQDRNFAQIGLGGWRTGGRFNGDIDIQAGGDFFMQGGVGTDAYVQVGHGGIMNNANGPNSGLDMPAIFDPQNGHATLSGDISIVAGGDIGMFSGTQEDRSYSLVGHGGLRRVADYILDNGMGTGVVVAETERGHHGDILLDAGGSVTFQASAFDKARYGDVSGNQMWTQLGHGGYESLGDHYGLITVNAGDQVTFAAGLGGWEQYRTGNDDYNGQQTGGANYAHLGHGGDFSALANARDTTTSGGSTGTNNRAYLWNGNTEGVGLGVIGSSDISITSTGGGLDVLAVQVQGSKRDDQMNDQTDDDGITPRPTKERNVANYAMIGHGGRHTTQVEETPRAGATNTGDITIDVAGPVNVLAGALDQIDLVGDPAGVGGEEYNNTNFSMIGHGGFQWQSSHTGDIFLNSSGDVNVTAGFGLREYAQIGHGGYQSAFAGAIRSNTQIDGDVTVFSGGSVNLQGNSSINENADLAQIQLNFAHIGHGAIQRDQTIDGDITVAATNDVRIEAGVGLRDGYAHLGHGGILTTDADITGNIDVTAGRDVFLENKDGIAYTINFTDGNYAKLGHGDTSSARGNSAGTWNGDILVKAGRDVHSIGGMIGSADPDNGAALTKSTAGDTFISAGGTTATAGAGVLRFETNVHDFLLGTSTETRISNGFIGLGSEETRLYAPSAAENEIASGTRINGITYDRVNPGAPGDPARVDEFTASGPVLGTGAFGQPTGTFNPADPYDSGLRFNVFYPEVAAGGGGGGGGGALPPLNVLNPFQQSEVNTVFNTVVAGEDQTDQEYLFYTDAFGNQYLVGLGLDDVLLEEDEDGNYYYSFVEDSLDSIFGKESADGIAENAERLSREEAEELLRKQRISRAGVGLGSLTFYVYNPDTNQYSSLRIFGAPQSTLGILQGEN